MGFELLFEFFAASDLGGDIALCVSLYNENDLEKLGLAAAITVLGYIVDFAKATVLKKKNFAAGLNVFSLLFDDLPMLSLVCYYEAEHNEFEDSSFARTVNFIVFLESIFNLAPKGRVIFKKGAPFC